MASHITLKVLRQQGRHVTLRHADDSFLWIDQARVYGIEREDGEVVLIVGDHREQIRVEADAFLDFVGIRPVRTE
jgi:hypothetical protein